MWWLSSNLLVAQFFIFFFKFQFLSFLKNKFIWAIFLRGDFKPNHQLTGRWALVIVYAAVNGHLELPLLKDRQRFNAVLMSNLEVYKFQDWWILTYFIFGHGESSLTNIWSLVNLERTCVLLFYYFLCLKAKLDVENTNQLGESSPNFIFAVVNLDPIILEKMWIDGESWPNDFVEKVNRGEDLRWVGSRCPLTHALEQWKLAGTAGQPVVGFEVFTKFLNKSVEHNAPQFLTKCAQWKT